MIQDKAPGCQGPWREGPNEKNERLRLDAGPDAIRLPEQIVVTAQSGEVGIHTRTFDLSRRRHNLLVEV